MKFEAFYKEAYDAEMEELFSDHASETENKPSKDSCDLLMKKADLEFSQYKLVKSEKCYDYLLGNLYPKAAEIAKMQGGNLILDIDEERKAGILGSFFDEYIGRHTSNGFSCICNDNGRSVFI